MKKLRIPALIAALAFTLCACGCGLFNHNTNDPSPIDIPTSEPTDIPTVLDNAVIESFIGDWYGIFKVAEAKGVYAPNSGVINDCAMRVSVDNFGKGACYLQVNGMERDAVSGSTNLFALCTAAINGNALDIEGMISRLPVDWSFTLEGGVLRMVEVYGDVDNHMRVEISLARPDALAGCGFIPEAMDHLIAHGFAGVIDKLGGSSSELPAITVPEGVDAHLFFDPDSPAATPAPTEDPNIVYSKDGHIRLTLPEGYTVVSNTVMDFSVACPDEGLLLADFTVSNWGTDSLSFLMGNTPNVDELYHYTIDGYDFYGTFIAASPEETEANPDCKTIFKLCGTNGTGSLIIINMATSLDAYSAYTYVNVENEAFTTLILGANFYD